MLRSVKEMEGYAVGATDGVIGHVKDFYLDDEAWVIRYLVVDTGGWLSSRKVLVSPIAIGLPDQELRLLPASIRCWLRRLGFRISAGSMPPCRSIRHGRRSRMRRSTTGRSCRPGSRNAACPSTTVARTELGGRSIGEGPRLLLVGEVEFFIGTTRDVVQPGDPKCPAGGIPHSHTASRSHRVHGAL